MSSLCLYTPGGIRRPRVVAGGCGCGYNHPRSLQRVTLAIKADRGLLLRSGGREEAMAHQVEAHRADDLVQRDQDAQLAARHDVIDHPPEDV